MRKTVRSPALVLALCLLFSLVPPISAPAQAAGNCQIFTGEYNSAIIDGNGDLYLCGRNDTGAVGNGGISDAKDSKFGYAVQTSFVKVLSNVKSFYDNGTSMAAITENDELYLWGASYDGSLGTGSASHQPTPVKVMENVASFSAMHNTYAAITKSGELYTWGSNYWGTVGINGVETQTSPVKILENVGDVQLTPFAAAALTGDGKLYLWGAPAPQQTGVGIPEGAETSITVQGDGNKTEVITKPFPYLDNIADFRRYSMFTAALTKSGELYIWGGKGSDFQADPKKVLTGVASIETIAPTGCAAIKENGELYHCYAGSSAKATKIGQNAAYSISDQLYLTIDGKLFHITSKKTLLNDVISADSKGALTKSGALYLVNETKGTVTKAMDNVVWQGNCKAVTASGELYGWGYNLWGHMGIGSTEDQETPVKIMEGLALPKDAMTLTQSQPESEKPREDTETEKTPAVPSSIPQLQTYTIAAVSDNAAAILENGDLYVWGRNDFGTVGNGGAYDTVSAISKSITLRTTPAKVLSDVASVVLGTGGGSFVNSAAILKNGDLYVWGNNQNGSVGNGGTGDRTWTNSDGTHYLQTTPQKIMSNVVSVGFGTGTTVAITNTRDLYAWGRLAGTGTKEKQTTPAKILSNVALVRNLTMNKTTMWAAITTGGELYVWGDITFFNISHLLPEDAKFEYFTNGDGTKFTYLVSPEKIMDDICDINAAPGALAVISQDGSLLEMDHDGQWTKTAEKVSKIRYGYYGAPDRYLTLDGDVYERTEKEPKWKKVLSGIADISDAYNSGDSTCWGAALAKNGDFYVWPKSGGKPEKVLSNVADFRLDASLFAAVTRSGELYLWDSRSNAFGTVGNGTTEPQKEPCLTLENVALPGSTKISISAPWYLEAMDYANTNHLTRDIPAGLFCAGDNLSRAMLAQMLYNLEGRPAVSGSPFTDVVDGMWYADAITWAAEHKIVGGYGGGLFGPNDSITRQQMAAILYRYAAYKGYDTSARAELSGFSDASAIQSYAADAMGWASAEKLINGVTATTLSPAGTATCAQMATILMRFIGSHI